MRRSLEGVALLVVLSPVFAVGLVRAGPALAASPCWQRVITDWSDNGRIDRSYGAACYHAAIEHLPEDLRTYSSAPDDIQRALLESRPAAGPVREAALPALHLATQPDTASGDLAVTILSAIGGVLALLLVVWLVWRRPRRLYY